MGKVKSLLQRVQSRISKRRNKLHGTEMLLENHFYMKAFYGNGTLDADEVKLVKNALKVGGDDQRLDKAIYRVLLNQERSKSDIDFKSSYQSVKSENLCKLNGFT